ncbi:hypothetical protein JCM19045_518 [Bacillus sp. JCM 19045]|nr:hypothetical protein JCM19045_518 [Bacillus sp. JCM 19045]
MAQEYPLVATVIHNGRRNRLIEHMVTTDCVKEIFNDYICENESEELTYSQMKLKYVAFT